MGYDANLISELGAKRYLEGVSARSTSNIDFFARGPKLQKKWEDCNFGCHGPAYRLARKPARWRDFISSLDKIDPMLAGVVDGLHHNTIKQGQKIAGGVNRTAEGLHIKGGKAFDSVGAENWAVIDLLSTTFANVLKFELDVMDNPIMQSITAVINEYVSVIPEWIVEDMIISGAIVIDGLDKVALLKAIQKGVVEASADQVENAVAYAKNPAKRMLGKQIGKKLAPVLASAIATKIAKTLLSQNKRDAFAIKRDLVSIKKQLRPAGGGMGKALVFLLKQQGFLDMAAQSSRKLRASCPRLWTLLRSKLHGCDMIYFLVEPMLEEYIDRLSILEKRPQEFIKIMAALYKAKKTKQILYPGMY